MAHRDELSEFVGDEISRVIDEQRKLESKYEELIAMRGELKGLSNKSKYKQNQSDIQEVSRALRESTKNLCRNLKDNPNVTGNLLKIQDERSELEELIVRTVNELRETRTYSLLCTHVEETKKEQERLEEMVETEKRTANSVKELEEELEHERKEHEQEEEDRSQTIAQLKVELQEVRDSLTFKTKYARREAHAKLGSTVRQYQQQEQDLLDKIDSLSHSKEMEEHVHEETVNFLVKKQERLLAQATDWGDRYTNDLEELDVKLQELGKARETDRERLQALEVRWAKQIAVEEVIKLKAKQEEEAKVAEIAFEKEANAAAVKIQRRYRRHAADSKEKGKGKGKAKGKAKGKGKGKKKKK